MDLESNIAELRAFYTGLLGERAAEQYLSLARQGFTLRPVDSAAGAGACRFGGSPLLEPGTSWPECEGFPLSFLAVLDVDALRPWLGEPVPEGIGLLNFFYLDGQTEKSHDEAWTIEGELGMDDITRGAVIRADLGTAVDTPAPDSASVFDPMVWSVEPGLVFPDAPWDNALSRIEFDDADDSWPAFTLGHKLSEVDEFPAGVLTPGRGSSANRWSDSAFGWPYYSANPPAVPKGVDLDDYYPLLQLYGNDQWYIGGDGGSLHFFIPRKALVEADFSQAIGTMSIS